MQHSIQGSSSIDLWFIFLEHVDEYDTRPSCEW